MNICMVLPYDYYHPSPSKPSLPDFAKYVKGLSKILVDNSHEVTILAKRCGILEKYSSDKYYFFDAKVIILPWTGSDIEWAMEVHRWLVKHPVDVVESISNRYPLLIEQIVGGNPTIIRIIQDFMDIGKDKNVQITNRQEKWSEHLLEVNSIKKADVVLCTDKSHLDRILALGCRNVCELSAGLNDINYPLDLNVEDRKEITINIGDMNASNSGKEFIISILEMIPPKYKVSIIGECSEDLVSSYRPEIEKVFSGEFSWSCDSLSKELRAQQFCSSLAVIAPTTNPGLGYSILEPMFFGCPVITFDLGLDWPTWTLGPEGNKDSLKAIPQAIEIASRQVNHDLQKIADFANTKLWSKIVKEYEVVYNLAINNSLNRGRLRSW